MKMINTVGVVGAGTMGAALAQKFAQEGFQVILADRAMQYVDKGLANIKATLADGVAKKVFAQTQVDQYLNNLRGTDQLAELKNCDLVVEAIFENFDAKAELFHTLGEILSPECIVATNTSSFSVTDLAKNINLPERFIGLHFFYHAAKNRLVEIIPGEKTSAETTESVRVFSVLAGKDAIFCLDRYGFAVNRFFVPWLNESARLLQEGVASMEEIDMVCMKLFGIGMGPFALMNATGVPVAYNAEKTLEAFGKLYEVAPALKAQAESNQIWPIGELPTEPIDPKKEKIIADRMLAVVFFVSSQLLEEKVSSATDLNRGAKIGLRWRFGPVDLMRTAGIKEVNRLVNFIAQLYGMPVPDSIQETNWKMDMVRLEKKYPVAIITMDQPEYMNALNEDMVCELSEKFMDAENDPAVNTIFITGSGKAFVAGADIKFFVKNIKANKIVDIETFTAYGQQVFEKIDKSKKKVVAMVNGLALGGGLELALCADMIVAMPKAQFAFPETGIGIYPGLGGTQRSVQKIGKGLSKFMIHTGKMIGVNEAIEIGLVDAVVGIQEGMQMMSGALALPEIKPVLRNEKWKLMEGFFNKHSLTDLLSKKFTLQTFPQEEAEKISKTISFKAPIALKIADQLIEAAKGPASELTYLKEIFSSSDALLGLSSIGKKVQFEGK